MTAILGISAFYHDSAAALVVDGEIVAAAQEERFTRKKHDPGLPDARRRLLPREAGLTPSDLDYVAFYDKPLTKFERLLETYLAFVPQRLPQLPHGHAALAQGQAVHARGRSAQLDWAAAKARLVFLDHHESHAASASSPARSTRPPSSRSTASASGAPTTLGIGQGNRHHA